MISNQIFIELDSANAFNRPDVGLESHYALSELSTHWFPKFMFGIRALLKSRYMIRYENRHRIENLDPEQGAIIVSNHEAGIDPFFIGPILPKQVFTLTKWKEAQKSSMFLKVAKFFGSVPVAEGGNHLARQLTEQLLTKGKYVLLFPEGAIHPLKKNYLGRKGFAWFAASTGVPVIPIGIRGNGTLEPNGRNYANGVAPRYKSRITLNFGNPISFDSLAESSNAITTFRDQVMYQIRTLSHWYGVPKTVKETLIERYTIPIIPHLHSRYKSEEKLA